MLACGPYFRPSGLVSSLLIFLVVKPQAYYAFLLGFRYRVSRPIPMTRRQAAKLAAVRAIPGVRSTTLTSQPPLMGTACTRWPRSIIP